MSALAPMTCWFFGILPPHVVGHFLYDEALRRCRPGELHLASVDQWYTPPPPQTQGLARLSMVRRGDHVLTILAWWDRSADRRYGGNSALLVSRECTLAEVLAEGQRAFPTVMARQPVTPYVVAPEAS